MAKNFITKFRCRLLKYVKDEGDVAD